MKIGIGSRSNLDKNDVLSTDKAGQGLVVLKYNAFKAGDFRAEIKRFL